MSDEIQEIVNKIHTITLSLQGELKRRARNTNGSMGINKPVENFVSSPAQSGFRRGSQTTDVVWTYRWLQAIATKFDAEFHMFGIDFSKAFDSLNRTTLMGILEKILEPTELRIIQYLLSDTVLKPKTRGKLGASFRTTIGTPQGDALSPVLFTVYLEHVLREVRPLFDQWLWQEGNVHPRSGNSVCR
jgi:hypothetical protein